MVKKYIYYFFLFQCTLVFSQDNYFNISKNKITLEDAVLNRWDFYPERVYNLQWNNVT